MSPELTANLGPAQLLDASDKNLPSFSASAKLPGENSQQSRPADSWIGRKLRDYVIEDFVGAGGMGRVYRARHEWLDMPVAIKIIHDELAADEASVARFRREALAVARLNHPGIIRATDGGVESDCFYLVTEFVHGQNLAQLLRQRQRLSVADACAIICQAAEALQHAYENNMVHRDVKPSNLMVTVAGQVKLLDLGLARFSNHSMTLTETGQVMGTLDFMAPEQAGDTRRVDIRADIYSLGCTFYCLLTGRPPFYGPEYDTAVSKMLAHAEVDPPPITYWCKQIPPAVVRCLSMMMAKDREHRPQTPAEVVTALRPFAGQAKLDLLCSTAGYANGTAQASTTVNSGTGFDGFCDELCSVMWVILRTLLCIAGIIQRNPMPVMRPGSAPKYLYEVSAKGIFSWFCFAGMMFFIFVVMGFRIYFEPPPGMDMQGSPPPPIHGQPYPESGHQVIGFGF